MWGYHYWRDTQLTDAEQRRILALYESRYESIRARVRRKVSDLSIADDIAAGAFFQLARAYSRGSAPADPEAFLDLAASGLLKNHWRDTDRRPDEPVGLLDELDELAQAQAPTWSTRDFGSRFDSAVRALPGDERDAFILTELRGLTVREAAPVLGVGKTTTAERAEAARTFIRKELASPS